MAIYIKGMEMPKNCDECRCICSRWNGDEMIWRCGLMLGEESESTDRDELYELCPLTDIPEPHGRLIDADAICDEMKEYSNMVFETGYLVSAKNKFYKLNELLEEAPTVIEGSE